MLCGVYFRMRAKFINEVSQFISYIMTHGNFCNRLSYRTFSWVLKLSNGFVVVVFRKKCLLCVKILIWFDFGKTSYRAVFIVAFEAFYSRFTIPCLVLKKEVWIKVLIRNICSNNPFWEIWRLKQTHIHWTLFYWMRKINPPVI